MSRGAHNLVDSRRLSLSLIHQSIDSDLDDETLTLGDGADEEKGDAAAVPAPSTPSATDDSPFKSTGSRALLRAFLHNDSSNNSIHNDDDNKIQSGNDLPPLEDFSGARGRGGNKERRRSSLGSVASSVTFDDDVCPPPLNDQATLSIMARVRAFLPDEKMGSDLAPSSSSATPCPSSSSYILTNAGPNRLVLVNPQAFQADTEVVIGLAAAVNRMASDKSKHLGHLHSNEWAKAFEFDRTFWSAESEDGLQVDQAALYGEIGGDMVMEAMINEVDVTCFAYGASGSGKTYTLFGTEEALQDKTFSHDDLGLIPRVFFSALQYVQAGATLRLSFLEISQVDGLKDLLGASKRGPLRIREHPEVGPFVENLHVVNIKTENKLFEVMQRVRQRLCLVDERAHVLVTAYVNKGPTNGGVSRNTRIQFVDLAGWDKGHTPLSPRKPFRGSPNKRASDPLHSNINIQQSLTALGSVLKQLGRKGETGPSARSSALTWLTKSGMGERSHTYLLLCVSPCPTTYQDTLHTLKFGEARIAGGASDENGAPVILDISASSAPGTPIRDDDVTDWNLVKGDDYNGLIRRLSGGNKEGARKVLKEIVADPQQKLAKLQSAWVGERRAKLKTVSIQTTLAGDDVISRETLLSSHETGRLRSQAMQLELQMQSLTVDRDVAVSEARIAQEELLRLRHQELDVVTKKAKDLEQQLADAKSDQVATERVLKKTESEKNHLIHLLEETRVSHEEELKAMETELEVAKNEVSVLNARCFSPSFVQELEELQARLVTANEQKSKIEQKLASAKVRIKELEQEAANTAKYKMELRKEMSLLKSKLAEQSQTVADMKAAMDQTSVNDQGELARLKQENSRLMELACSQEKFLDSQRHEEPMSATTMIQNMELQRERTDLTELVRSQQSTIDELRQEFRRKASQAKKDRAQLSQLVQSKDNLLERQQDDASALAEALYRRVMALEGVALLDGLPLKEGLRREAGALARELSGWMGRADAQPLADRLPLDAGIPREELPLSEPRIKRPERTVDNIYNKMYDTLRAENEDLKARLHESQKEAASVMEKSLVEILLGIRDDHDRVRKTVLQLNDGKERAEDLADNLRNQLTEMQDYRGMLRAELASLWMTMNKANVIEAAKSSTLLHAQEKLNKAGRKAMQLQQENLTLKASLESAARRHRDEDIDLYEGRGGQSARNRSGRRTFGGRLTSDKSDGDLEQVIVAECETALEALLASQQEEATDRYRYSFYDEMDRKKRSRRRSSATSDREMHTCFDEQRHGASDDSIGPISSEEEGSSRSSRSRQKHEKERSWTSSLRNSSTPTTSTQKKRIPSSATTSHQKPSERAWLRETSKECLTPEATKRETLKSTPHTPSSTRHQKSGRSWR